MKTITNVRTKVQEDRTLAIINAEGLESPIFLTGKQVASAVGVGSNFHVLKGSKINVEFYAKGEELYNGDKVTDDNKIVKSFEIEPSAQLEKIAMASATGASMFG